jgi:hypothetical protein
MLRIWLMAMLAAAVLITVKDQDVLHRAGLIGYCTITTAPPGAKSSWRVCEKGKPDGRPDLSRQSCRRQGHSHSVEYWSQRNAQNAAKEAPTRFELVYEALQASA